MPQTALVVATSGETLALMTAVIAALAAAISTCIAAWQSVLMKRSERNRTQPIVVAYERRSPTRQDNDLVFAASLANEGAGAAFNVRFGITLDGVEYAYKAHPAGPEGAGDVPRALGPGWTLLTARTHIAFSRLTWPRPRSCSSEPTGADPADRGEPRTH